MIKFITKLFAKKEDNLEIKEFWNWFLENNSNILSYLDKNNYSQLFEILDGKTVFWRKNGILIEFNKNITGYDMIITAQGNKEYFELIKDIVKNAPKLYNIKPIALRQKTGIKSIDLGDYVIDAEKILIYCEINDHNKINIKVLFNGDINEDIFLSDIFTLLDHILGEENIEKYIGNIELVDDLSEYSTQIFSLAQLDEYIKLIEL